MGGGLRRPKGPFQVICVLVTVAPAVAFSISPLNTQPEQRDVGRLGGVALDIAGSIEMGGSQDRIVDAAMPVDEETRHAPPRCGRRA
jgi:hypothetical protein